MNEEINECEAFIYKHRFVLAWFWLLISGICPRASSKNISRGTYQKAILSTSQLYSSSGFLPSVRCSSLKSLPCTGLSSSLPTFSSNMPPRENDTVLCLMTQHVTPVKVLFWVGPSYFIYLMDFRVWIMEIISGICRTGKQPVPVEVRRRSSRDGLASQTACLWRRTMCCFTDCRSHSYWQMLHASWT